MNGEDAKQVFRWDRRGGHWTLNLQLAVGETAKFWENCADAESVRAT